MPKSIPVVLVKDNIAVRFPSLNKAAKHMQTQLGISVAQATVSYYMKQQAHYMGYRIRPEQFKTEAA